MAEGQGFEPWEVLPSLVFKTVPSLLTRQLLLDPAVDFRVQHGQRQ